MNEVVEQVEEEEFGEVQFFFFIGGLMVVVSFFEREMEWFRELLLYGCKKDVLEFVMKNGLWGYVLLFVSKMDSWIYV